MEKITTALIPAGGWGTRFLPITKSIPKEMLPLGNKPIILHVVEEAVASGIKNIIFVVAHHKQSIESFFSTNELIEDYFLKIGKKKEVETLKKISQLATFSFVYANPPFGNGSALIAARHLLENKPFVLVWSDEVIISKKSPRIKQCLQAYYKYKQPVISAVKIEDPEKREKYGMAILEDIPGEKEIKKIKKIIEKPKPKTKTSAYATHGAYVLPPNIFKFIDKTKLDKNNELWLTDIINNMKKKTGLLAKIITDGHYLDCGDPLSYLYSQVDYFVNYSESNEDVLKNLNKNVCKRF
jgi:UTP--glucose-1-phosphate uridylyltransferase